FLKLLIKLHNAGLVHLDISPENILIENNGELRLCDLAKCAPMYTHNLRHIKGNGNDLYSFQPCVGKIPCIPKECWDIIREHIKLKIDNPFEHLSTITDQKERKKYYFDVHCVDKYMLGIFYIWIWNLNYIWKRADPPNDRTFNNFLKYNLN
ncbi:hypothetical protein K1I93_09520, partial [Streptococcus australis]|nr:hypothetical protein [Streptococcus australis]